jgi:hypothetical protein
MALANILACCLYISALGPQDLGSIPVCTQFSPVPSGKGWHGEEGPLSETVIKDTIDNILAHGFTGIEAPTRRSPEEDNLILSYAQSQGMFISIHLGSYELFGRDAPPEISVYSPEYPVAVRKIATESLKSIRNMPRLFNAFTFQDEPFHAGPKSFSYSPADQAEFKKRYGYDLPGDIESVRHDPQKWLDVLNFHSSAFPDGWRQVYQIIKEISPEVTFTLTHDSHNTFGGGYGSHTEIAIDDVIHWGGDFADLFVYDIYPYNNIDFRFGEPSVFPKPRMSQTHYSFAQMRNLTTHAGKRLGFWVETYNPEWHGAYFNEESRKKHWSDREMALTAVAQGADYLLLGRKIPVDADHWESFGEGLNLLKKAGPDLLQMPKVKARAAMLFPRTQYLQLQHEYFDVGLSFEAFLRAYGEIDILHEDQVTEDSLEGYNTLVLFDVELLPKKVSGHIKAFVEKGGLLIADSVPTMDELRQPDPAMQELFGVKNPNNSRILRTGLWIGYKNTYNPTWAFRPENTPDERSLERTTQLKGEVAGKPFDMQVVSPRACDPESAQVLLKNATGQPGLTTHQEGKGQIYQLGFCVLDTYFKHVRDNNTTEEAKVVDLLRTLALSTGVLPHVRSTAPRIEAAVRVGKDKGFLFVINHESDESATTVYLNDLGFSAKSFSDVGTGQAFKTFEENGSTRLDLDVPLGEVRIIKMER